MLIWRWDQGRLDYFRFENIVNIARVLTTLDGVDLTSKHDLIRQPLESGTGLPFSPSHYKVWRNYGRVFACSMLSAKVGGKLFVTDLCRSLAAIPAELTSDQYFNFIFTRFKLPYPAFEDYDPRQEACCPVCCNSEIRFYAPGWCVARRCICLCCGERMHWLGRSDALHQTHAYRQDTFWRRTETSERDDGVHGSGVLS